MMVPYFNDLKIIKAHWFSSEKIVIERLERWESLNTDELDPDQNC